MAKKKKTAAKKTTKKTATKGKRSAGSQEMLIVGSKYKNEIKTHGMNVSGESIQALNSYVHWLIDQAAKRAQSNGRKTVRPHDFMSI